MIGAAVGGLAGLVFATIGIYYYFFAVSKGGWIQWVGRSSYVLVLFASASHLAVMIHLWRRLDAEVQDVRGAGGEPQSATLSLRRRTALREFQQSGGPVAERKARDDEAVEELVGVFGERLLIGQRAVSRIPFYGYLGTVCGILLMARELSGLDEATETFQVLRDMASGLVLAFQTTLVALLAYLPLRKGMDLLMSRVAALERSWLTLRDDGVDEGAGR
jgi:biopolymer transport protein ExbB/TolQ